jgi:hypothetical protein
MVYPFDGDPVVQRLLETLVANMGAIKEQSSYHHNVDKAYLYEGRQIVTGTQNTVIIVVPGQDDSSNFISCTKVEHLLTVSVVGAIKFAPTSTDWKKHGRWLLADMVRAVALDMQLGGDAEYAEPKSEDLFDAGNDTVAVCQLTLLVKYGHVFDNPSLTA